MGRSSSLHLSMRGRNLSFIDKIHEIFLLDSENNVRSLEGYKKAFTANAVRRLNEEIVKLWPPNIDIETVLKKTSSDVSGLYVGDYSGDQLMQAIVRHSTYATKLLIIDPFIYPLSVRDEFSPLHNPDQHRYQTLKNVNIWLKMAPWIEAGLVEVIRTPCDFDHRLQWDSMKEQQEKFSGNEKLREAAETSVAELMKRHSEKWKLHNLLLASPDSSLIRDFLRVSGNTQKIDSNDFLSFVNQLRANDPDFLEPINMSGSSGQLQMITSGAGYNIARLTASWTGSYLITDLTSKWKEIELDREGRTAETQAWSPFAKAIQETQFNYLQAVSLEAALRLRQEERLGSLRAFLRKVWKQACEPDSFGKVNGGLLADELESEVQKAKEEWRQIDRTLLSAAGAIGGGLAAIGIAQGEFLAAATLVAGVPLLATSTWQRRGFPDKHPAAFFLRL